MVAAAVSRGASPAAGRHASFESTTYSDTSAALIRLTNQLRDAGAACEVAVPTIAVCGNQVGLAPAPGSGSRGAVQPPAAPNQCAPSWPPLRHPNTNRSPVRRQELPAGASWRHPAATGDGHMHKGDNMHMVCGSPAGRWTRSMAAGCYRSEPLSTCNCPLRAADGYMLHAAPALCCHAFA